MLLPRPEFKSIFANRSVFCGTDPRRRTHTVSGNDPIPSDKRTTTTNDCGPQSTTIVYNN